MESRTRYALKTKFHADFRIFLLDGRQPTFVEEIQNSAVPFVLRVLCSFESADFCLFEEKSTGILCVFRVFLTKNRRKSAIQNHIGFDSPLPTLAFFKPYSLGDYIVLSSCEGTVSDIGIFYTTILDINNRKVVIPNSIATNEVIKNYSSEKLAQVIIEVSVSYNEDLEKVEKIIRNIAENEDSVIKDKPITVRFTEYAESGINISFRCWCENFEYWEVKNRLFINIKKTFDNENIEIPYNKIDVCLTEKK